MSKVLKACETTVMASTWLKARSRNRAVTVLNNLVFDPG